MKAYVIRFKRKDGQSASAEFVAETEEDARADFIKKNPDCEIISSHVKPGRY